MGLSNSDIELMDKFISGEMNPADIMVIEEKRKNREFEEELQFRISAVEVIKEKGRIEIKERLKKIEREMAERPRVINARFSTYQIVMAAIGILMVGMIGTYLWTDQSGQRVYKEYYAIYPNLVDPITKSGEEAEPSAYQLYEMRKYAQALRSFESETSNKIGQLYMGLCQMELDRWEEAGESFLKITTDSDDTLRYPAQWYLALVYIRTNKEAEARLLLNKIATDPLHPYRSSAVELLKDL